MKNTFIHLFLELNILSLISSFKLNVSINGIFLWLRLSIPATVCYVLYFPVSGRISSSTYLRNFLFLLAYRMCEEEDLHKGSKNNFYVLFVTKIILLKTNRRICHKKCHWVVWLPSCQSMSSDLITVQSSTKAFFGIVVTSLDASSWFYIFRYLTSFWPIL